MRNIKMIFEYCGTGYCGWAKQPNLLTVEGILLSKLENILEEKQKLIFASRTDAGVHARGQVVNFHTKKPISCGSLVRALNSYLPGDIHILSAEDIKMEFHSRFSAKKKDYQYIISQKYSVFEKGLTYYFPYKIDLNIMKIISKIFVGKHDFGSFSLTDKRRKTIDPVRNLISLSLVKKRDKILFNFSGDGFLRGMIRLICGALIEIGRGKIKIDDVNKMNFSKMAALAKKQRRILPPEGLYLVKVHY